MLRYIFFAVFVSLTAAKPGGYLDDSSLSYASGYGYPYYGGGFGHSYLGGHIGHSYPPAISHQSSTIFHDKHHPIIKPIVKTYLPPPPVVKTYLPPPVIKSYIPPVYKYSHYPSYAFSGWPSYGSHSHGLWDSGWPSYGSHGLWDW